IMGFHLENKKAGVVLEGHCGQKSRFAMPAGIDIFQTGHVIVTLPEFDERYLVTLPTLNIRGIITGRPAVELAGSTYITSTAGLLATIDYSTKGFFSGHRHSFKATLKPIDGDSPFYVAQGVWSGMSNYSNGTKGAESKLFFDAEVDMRIPPQLKPLEEMGPLESHKLWANVTKAINSKDHGAASKEKSQIEDAQRVMAKERKEKGETQAHALKVFSLVEGDSDDTGKAFQTLKAQLVETAGHKAVKEDETMPHWRLRS
ncbi:Oxysterol binding protein, partial [Dissophora ornata]